MTLAYCLLRYNCEVQTTSNTNCLMEETWTGYPDLKGERVWAEWGGSSPQLTPGDETWQRLQWKGKYMIIAVEVHMDQRPGEFSSPTGQTQVSCVVSNNQWGRSGDEDTSRSPRLDAFSQDYCNSRSSKCVAVATFDRSSFLLLHFQKHVDTEGLPRVFLSLLKGWNCDVCHYFAVLRTESALL